MIVVRLSGGIGNQLFQYGVGYSLSKQSNLPLLFDTSSFTSKSPRSLLLNELIHDLPVISYPLLETLVEPRNFIKRITRNILGFATIPKVLEPHPGFCDDIALINYPCYLKGSFISYKYFSNWNDEFISTIEFSETLKNEALTSLNTVTKNNLVCISIRRGDFLDYSELNVCGREYYERCISWVRANLDNPEFLFFSDDIDWVKENFVDEDFNYWDVKEYHILMKLYAMTRCCHFIISNSSYSWWGAWLNKNESKVVLCPSKVVKNGSFPVNDYYPDSWVKIEP